MSSHPRWVPGGTEPPESRVERTDPLLPVVSNDPPPAELSRVPTLDDRTLAGLLAELDGEPETPTVDAAPLTRPPEPSRPVDPSSRSTSVSPGSPGSRSSRYVRRDPRPPAAPVEVPTLTGLSRRSRGRVGSIAFTVVFVAIFLLILVQAVASVFAASM